MQLSRSHFGSSGWLLVVISVCGLACAKGEKLNSVEGQVLYKSQPLGGALVSFHPKETRGINVAQPTGFTKEDGTFSVTSGPENGAPAGEYVITIICSEVIKPAKPKQEAFSMGTEETQDRLKGAYAERGLSKITVRIKSGVNKLEPFRLD